MLPSAEMMRSMGFYEIFGVKQNVHIRTTQRKRKSLSDLCIAKYGKDSDRYHVIRTVGEVLSNPSRRKTYDEQGRASFEHLFATTLPPSSVPAQPSSVPAMPPSSGSALPSSSSRSVLPTGSAQSIGPALMDGSAGATGMEPLSDAGVHANALPNNER